MSGSSWSPVVVDDVKDVDGSVAYISSFIFFCYLVSSSLSAGHISSTYVERLKGISLVVRSEVTTVTDSRLPTSDF